MNLELQDYGHSNLTPSAEGNFPILPNFGAFFFVLFDSSNSLSFFVASSKSFCKRIDTSFANFRSCSSCLIFSKLAKPDGPPVI